MWSQDQDSGYPLSGKNLSAKDCNYPDKILKGYYARFAESTSITKVKLLAGQGSQTKLIIAYRLESDYRISASEWQKLRGDT